MKPFKLKNNPINIDEKQFTKWLVKLWENDLPQGRLMLQGANGYCCLGVACKILIKQPDLDGLGNIYGGVPSSQPKSPDWLKIINNRTHVILGVALSYLNDQHHFTFPEIADILHQVYVLGEYTTEGY